jgi:hypothetical protein
MPAFNHYQQQQHATAFFNAYQQYMMAAAGSGAGAVTAPAAAAPPPAAVTKGANGVFSFQSPVPPQSPMLFSQKQQQPAEAPAAAAAAPAATGRWFPRKQANPNKQRKWSLSKLLANLTCSKFFLTFILCKDCRKRTWLRYTYRNIDEQEVMGANGCVNVTIEMCPKCTEINCKMGDLCNYAPEPKTRDTKATNTDDEPWANCAVAAAGAQPWMGAPGFDRPLFAAA